VLSNPKNKVKTTFLDSIKLDYKFDSLITAVEKKESNFVKEEIAEEKVIKKLTKENKEIESDNKLLVSKLNSTPVIHDTLIVVDTLIVHDTTKIKKQNFLQKIFKHDR
jgi:hypothetical protein